MTGGELVEWIRENKAEDMQVLWVDDESMVYKAKPEIVENAELQRKYGHTGRLSRDGRSVVV